MGETKERFTFYNEKKEGKFKRRKRFLLVLVAREQFKKGSLKCAFEQDLKEKTFKFFFGTKQFGECN